MTNPYYSATGEPGTGAFAASAPMRSEFQDIEDGFDLLPSLTANTAVVVNSAGTALGNTVGTLALAGNFATTGAFAVTLSASAAVTLTLPGASGTLATLAGTEILSHKTLVAPLLGVPVSGDLTNCTGYPFTGLVGVLPAASFPALTGDVTTVQGALATTLATVNASPGSYGSTTSIPTFTVNAKGLITAITPAVVVAPAGTLTGTTLAANVVTSSLTAVGTIATGTWQGSVVQPTYGGTGISSLGTNVATALGVNVGSAGAFITFNGNAGTPSALVGTNITGTAAGLTAGTVTTNASLTGVINSSGNTTSIASQTGTGTKFVVDNTPTLITPVLGVATATSINKMAITAPATSSTLTVADGKTLTASNTLTFTGTDGSSAAFGTGGSVFTKVYVQVFTIAGGGSQTYSPHAGLIFARIECLGGGGGGGGAAASNPATASGGGGGGAGGRSTLLATAATIGASKAITIGAAGLAGTAGNNAGGNGGDTSVTTLCIGKGGTGGSGANNASTTGGLGGTAGTGDTTATGMPGGSTIAATAALILSGAGGSSLYGGGGRSIATPSSGSTSGEAGTGFGAGGSGGVSNDNSVAAAGGLGTAGYVVIYEVCNQ